MKGLLDYSPGNSQMHRLNPLTKLIISAVICACAFLSHSLPFICALIALNILLGSIAGQLRKALSIFKGLIKISIIFFLFQLIFASGDTILFTIPPGIKITQEGLVSALTVVSRLIAATMPLTLLLSVTPINDLTNVMVSKLRVPYKYAFMITTSMRFIPIFSDEMAGIIEAQKSRGVQFDTRNFLKKLRLIVPLCVPLLITSVRKIDGSAISAEIRGFDLRRRNSAFKKYPMGSNDAAALILCACLLGVAVFINTL